MVLMRNIGEFARGSVLNLEAFKDIPDEDALCFANPEYSCVTCQDVDCPDWGTRFASCSSHRKGE